MLGDVFFFNTLNLTKTVFFSFYCNFTSNLYSLFPLYFLYASEGMLSELLARKRHRELQTEILAEVFCIIISPAAGEKSQKKALKGI